ncbi:SRPBCC domain-containing protein [Sphingoaurantiacus capsulatus]|uniref:SRPBCC domain-containing protein n=1 Tax=Sphingoaurantiacus capsulatus TaxID=1771310 RepID=A0ABV7XE91_9SPHN
MHIASGLTRSGSVPAVLLFMRSPEQAQARIIYLEEDIGAPVDAVFAAFEAQLGAQAATPLAREAGALLTVQFAMPAEFDEIAAQRSVLTLTFEAKGADTKITLTHAGFGRGGAWDEALAYFTQGWPAVLLQMKDALEKAPREMAAV